MSFRISVSWLDFLVMLLKKGDDDLGGSALLSLCDDFGKFCLVREFRELRKLEDVRQIKAAI